MIYKVVNQSKKILVAGRAIVAKSFFQRLTGLMFRKYMEEQEALLFYQAPSIHMFFMRFAIDVVFLDKRMRVIRIAAGLKPWRMANCFGSNLTLELPSGSAAAAKIEIGDIIALEPLR